MLIGREDYILPAVKISFPSCILLWIATKRKARRGFPPLPSIFLGCRKEVRIAEFQIANVL